MTASGLAFPLVEAVRGFVRRKSTFVVALLMLALGLSLCTAMFCVLYGVLLRPLSFRNPHQLFVAWAGYEGGASERDTFNEQALEDWRRQGRSFTGLAAFRYTEHTLLQGGSEPADLQGAIVSPELFDVLGVQAQFGGVINPQLARAQQGKVVLLSQWLWRQRFGADPAVVGKGANLGGEIYTVTGVMPKDFDVPSADVAMWTPLLTDPAKAGAKAKNLVVIGRMRPAVTLPQAQAEVDGIARRLAASDPGSNRGMRIHLVPFFDEMTKESRPFVLVASGAALLVLLICCANVSNLLLTRAIRRRSEFAVRLAIGAQRRHLLAVVFAEALLLAVCGGIAAAGLARWMIAALVRSSTVDLPRSAEIGQGLQIPIIAGGLVLVTALLITVPSAWEVARSRWGSGAGLGSRTTSRRFARQAMVSFEMAIALTLLVGSGLMARTILALRNASSGFRTDHLLASQIYLPKQRYREPHQVQQLFETFIERLRATPGVVAVGASSAVPNGKTSIDFDLPIQVPGGPTDGAGRAAFRVVTPGYFTTMGIPLLEGRAFDERDRDPDVRRVMINRSFIKRYMPDAPSVVGKQFAIILGAPATYEVVGAVGDVSQYGLLREPKPEFYLPFASKPIGGMGVVVRTAGEPLRFVPSFRRQLWALDPELPVQSVDSMEHMVKDSWSDRSFLATMLVLLAAVAATLTILGVFSVVSFSVSQQVREIGIRMAMGARRDDVVQLVMAQAARAALAGLALGLVGAWLLGRGLASLIYGVSASDPPVLLGGAILVAVIAALGAYLPSRWAARLDPSAALRVE